MNSPWQITLITDSVPVSIHIRLELDRVATTLDSGKSPSSPPRKWERIEAHLPN